MRLETHAITITQADLLNQSLGDSSCPLWKIAFLGSAAASGTCSANVAALATHV
jgi:hypothetical protein